jgi:hypothetical protein
MSGQDAHFRIAFTVIFTDRAEWGLNAVWVALGTPLLAAVSLIAAVHGELGMNFSPTPRLRPDHALVTRRPAWASSSRT